MGGASLGALSWKNIVLVLGKYRKSNLGNLVERLGAVFIGVLVFVDVGIPSRNKVIDLVFGSRIGSGKNGWQVFAASARTGSNSEQRHGVVESIELVEMTKGCRQTETLNDQRSSDGIKIYFGQ